AKTASLLEQITGANTSAVRSYSTSVNYTGLDGTGIGIAVLDSGVMRSHKTMADAAGTTRVKRNVDMRNATLANFLTGVASTVSPAPNSTALTNYEAAIAADNVSTQDPYGHGTHVAGVAAGRGTYQSADSTGIAPGANIYDVKVLDADGNGSLSDVLEG